MIRSVVRRAALAALLLTVVACGGASSSAAPPVRTTSVDLPKSYRFAPADIVVSKGATVTWSNSDNFTHSVQFLDGGLPTDPMVMPPGSAPVSFTFTTPGLYHYHCSIHPNDMKGTVLVEP